MKRLLVLLLIAYPAFALPQNRFPDYRAVVTKFFSLYHHDSSPQEMLGFAKKRDGWYVQVLNLTKQDSIVSSQLFWSLQKGRYQVLESFVGANKDPLEQKVFNHINSVSYFPYGFARCIYYGYNGWDADIIRDFEKARAPGDTILESLARAYSAYASRYTWYQYGGGPLTDDTLQIKLDRVQMPGDERVKKIVQYSQKAIAAYEKIYQHNKSYQTFAGNVAGKYFDESFHAYFQLMQCNRPDEAQNFLVGCRLPLKDSLSALNLLNSCDPNAILFTFGDNDTYPLYFLQEKYHVRTDVTILHASLLGFAPYLELLKRKNNVRFVSTAAEYSKGDFDYLFYSEQPSGKLVKLSDFIVNRQRLKKVPTIGADSVGIYNDTSLYAPFANATDTLKIKLGYYLPMNDYIMMDIIAANIGQRPIYFSNLLPMIPYENLKRKGIAWQLSPANSEVAESMQQLDNYLRNQYKAPFDKANALSIADDYNVNKHVELYLQVVSWYADQGKREAENSLVKTCFAPFGERIPYIPNLDNLIPVLYANGFEELGDKLCEQFANTSIEYLYNHPLGEVISKDGLLAQLETIQSIMEKYNRNHSAVDEIISRISRQ